MAAVISQQLIKMRGIIKTRQLQLYFISIFIYISIFIFTHKMILLTLMSWKFTLASAFNKIKFILNTYLCSMKSH